MNSYMHILARLTLNSKSSLSNFVRRYNYLVLFINVRSKEEAKSEVNNLSVND